LQEQSTAEKYAMDRGGVVHARFWKPAGTTQIINRYQQQPGSYHCGDRHRRGYCYPRVPAFILSKR
jgi:hypothetical protein